MRPLPTIVACFVSAALGATSLAQPDAPPRGPSGPAGRDGGREGGQGRPAALTPEKSKAAWELQAAAVARRLGVDESKIKSIVKAYGEARESHLAAAEKMRKEMADKARESGEDGRGMGGMGEQAMRAIDALNTSEREKLSKALASSLSAEQVTKALASLGTFNRQWDSFADAVAGFNLDPAKRQQALDALEDYVVEQAKLRPGPDADREVLRAAMQESRQKLSDCMKKILSEEQFKQFESLMRGGRGMGRPRSDDGDRPPSNKGG